MRPPYWDPFQSSRGFGVTGRNGGDGNAKSLPRQRRRGERSLSRRRARPCIEDKPFDTQGEGGLVSLRINRLLKKAHLRRWRGRAALRRTPTYASGVPTFAA